MSKRRKHKRKGDIKMPDVSEELKEDEVNLYGSTNGWLKIIFANGVESILNPVGHTDKDAPDSYYILGKYNFDEYAEVPSV